MDVKSWLDALLGGALIGISVSLMLYLKGRVTGISGIIHSALVQRHESNAWRWMFILGLVLGGGLLNALDSETLGAPVVQEGWMLGVAGLLVGFGTLLGSGCTSGHGVCGISRWSPRSLLATVIFIATGVLSVAVLRFILGGLQ
jgi:uncharacterized membrane protein YedE/YeeE